jgi:TIR domain
MDPVPEADESSAGVRPTVFLSYASADREAARILKDAMPTFGLEVWYDESELGGGEAWDQKIRKQIRECDYFMPLISAQTEARHEGYFRREWRLAVERTLDMADDHAFLLPVVIDDTVQTGARVPEKFFTIQWLRVPGGRPTPALEALCRRLSSGAPVATAAAPAAPALRHGKRRSQAVPAQYPLFPIEQPQQKVRFWFHVVGWALQSAWIFFKQLPRWIRIIVSVWLCVVLLSKGCSSNHHESRDMSAAEREKLRAISDKYHGSLDTGDIARLATQIARIASDGDAETPAERRPVLAIPFMAPAGDAAAAKVADATFALVYGKVSISHRGQVGLGKETVSCSDLKAALDRGQSNHSLYILCGAVSAAGPAQALIVKIVSVTDGSVTWSKSYPVAGADPAQIAAEVDAQMPSLKDN